MFQQLMELKESWDPGSVNCKFRRYFYNKVEEMEVGRYQCALNENRYMWEEAQKNNPDRKQMVPVMVTGFEELRMRMKYISEQVEGYNNVSVQIDEKLEKLGGAFDSKVKRLREIKRRHGGIEQQMLKLNKNLQILKMYGQFLRAEEEGFKVRQESVGKGIYGSGGVKQQMLKLQNVIERLKLKRAEEGMVEQRNEQGAERREQQQHKGVAKVLEMHNSGLVYVSDTVARLNSELDGMS